MSSHRHRAPRHPDPAAGLWDPATIGIALLILAAIGVLIGVLTVGRPDSPPAPGRPTLAEQPGGPMVRICHATWPLTSCVEQHPQQVTDGPAVIHVMGDIDD